MIDNRINPDEQHALESLCSLARRDAGPSEFDVARLRRSVGRAVAAERAGRGRPAILRPLALAASMAIAVLSLTALRPAGPAAVQAGGEARETAGLAVPVRTASGAVAFRLPEGRTVRVVRTDSPRAEQGTEHEARGLYVDRKGAQAPGTVVFYRFD